MFMEQNFSVIFYVKAADFPVWVKSALDSVLSSTVCPAEIIIVVDGQVSQDIQAVLGETAQYKIVRIFYQPVPVLRATALAFAIKQCRFDLIALHGTDALSLPERFEKQLAYFAKHPETAVLGSWGQEIDKNTLLPTAIRKVPKTGETIKLLLRNRAPFLYQTVMFNKRVILKAGNYKAFPNLEDEYLWIRVLGKGYKTANLSEVLVNIYAVKADEQRVLALPYFRMKTELFRAMCITGLISRFTYYQGVCVAFITYLLLPNWLRKLFRCQG